MTGEALRTVPIPCPECGVGRVVIFRSMSDGELAIACDSLACAWYDTEWAAVEAVLRSVGGDGEEEGD